MKKFFKTISLALVVGATGLMTTSCGGSDIIENLTGGDNNIINTLVNIIGGLFNQGETYTYTGTSQAQAYVAIGTANEQHTDTTTFASQQVSIVATQSNNLTYATLTMPTYTWQSIQVTGLTLSNLDLTTADNVSSLAVGTSTGIDGSFVYNNKTYKACYAELKSAQVTQKGLDLQMTVQFAAYTSETEIDKSDVQQLDIIYSGTSTTTAQ